MRLLLDTNIFLEIILDQEQSASARALLSNPTGAELYVSDFSIHSIGVVLFRKGRHEAFDRFMSDMVQSRRMLVARLLIDDLTTVSEFAQSMSLDFDDAYQAVVASKHGLDVVSFDKDFDRTTLRRWTPSQVLNP